MISLLVLLLLLLLSVVLSLLVVLLILFQVFDWDSKMSDARGPEEIPRQVLNNYTQGELKAAMRSLGFETKNPTIFQMIADLDQDGRQMMK